MSDTLRTGTLVLATMATGLTAGVFVDWSNTIMPGLGDVDDRAFVATFQSLDAAITNPLFLGVEFTGGLVLTGAAAALHLRPEHRTVLLLLGAALLATVVSWGVTFAVNEPLNEKLRSVGTLESDADFAAARAVLDEARWTAWNTVRAVTSTVALGCLAGALAARRRLGRAS
jgi:uncharacterized membrane protein